MIKILLAVLFVCSNILFAQFTNIQINKPISKTPEEVTIAINPINPKIMAAGANIDFFYFSTNAGESWTEKRLSSSLGVWGDPCVIFDNSGNLYFAHLSNPAQGYWIDRIVVQKSTDNGLTWNNGSGIGYNYPKNQDKEWLAADLTNSPYKNNIYISWTEFDDYGSYSADDSSRILFSKSSDFGGSWSKPIKISDKSGNCVDSDETVEGAVPAVGPEGEIYVAWAGPEGIYFDKSTDGGESFTKDKIISDMPGGWDFDVPGISRCNGLPITACDNSKSKYRGNVYVLWGDQRNGTDNSDVFFMKSTDKGETWQQRIRVNDDNTSRHQFFPWMTVDSTSGIIYVIFYDRRNTNGTATDVYIARSVDGGDTFQNIRVSETSFIPKANIFFGDYTNIAAYKGKVRPVWMRLDENVLSVHTAFINDKDLITKTEEDKPDLILKPDLLNNYPNPFNPNTTISFEIPERGFVSIKVYDILGRTVADLLNEERDKGVYELNFSGENISSGVYFYQMYVGKYSASKKMVLMR